jgi:pyruvate carboxylase
MRVDKAGAPRREQRAQAEPGNPGHVPAPMPGMVVTVSVKAGQAVRAGDPLVSLEAMKMETQIRAERDGTIRAVHVRVGETVAARDLLVELS